MSTTVEQKSSQIKIDRSKTDQFVAAKEAAVIVGYSPDYVARLAREGKVLARQERRQWLVSLDSLKHFSLVQQAEQRQRQDALREARLAEYAKRQVSKQHDVLAHQQAAQRLPALLVTGSLAACVLLVCLLGVTVYRAELQVASLATGATTVWETVAGSLYQPTRITTPAPAATIDTPTAQAQVVITAEGLRVADGVVVSDVVSDPVVVTAQDATTMILEPVFSNVEPERYLVELVVTEATSTPATTDLEYE